MILDLLRSDGSIVVNKRLAHAVGLDAAIMFSELISRQKYFADKGQLTKDGFFFNTVEDIEEATTLSKYQQSKAIKKLVELQLIKHKNQGLPQKRYFKIVANEDLLREVLLLDSNLTSKSKKTEQLEVKEVNGNNIKSNNKKLIKRKDIYLISEVNEVFAYYSQKFKEHFGKDHPPMTQTKINQLRASYDSLDSQFDLNEDTWFELVEYHFDNLSPNNNGNILAFLASNGGHSCIFRYLEDIAY